MLDYESRFRAEVIDSFADSYLRGETPVPCIACNRTVKFRDLLRTARELGAEALATGHYVQRLSGEAGPELHRGADPARDQSYFLFGTTREQLDFLRFPLGPLPKSETRALAERFDLPVADKPDSQDICFVPNGDYASVVQKLRPEAVETGDIVDMAGRVVGRHDGIVRFTVGQRRGLALGALVVAISGILRGVATNYVTMLLAVGAFGIGGPLVSVGAPTVIRDWFTGRERGLELHRLRQRIGRHHLLHLAHD